LTLWNLLANAGESANPASENPTRAVRVAVAGEEVAHKHSSDVLVVHGQKYGTQVGIRGKWEI